VDSNLNLKDFSDSPVQYYIDEPINIYLDSENLSINELMLQPVRTEFMDHMFAFWEQDSHNYFHVGQVTQQVRRKRGPGENILMSLKIRLD
jgi:hypothetical protein